jgi:hypothetical protein
LVEWLFQGCATYLTSAPADFFWNAERLLGQFDGVCVRAGQALGAPQNCKNLRSQFSPELA